MRLLEYEAKQLLSKAGLAIPHGQLIAPGDIFSSITVPVVLKSQVPIGGRGKLGGVKIVRSADELQSTADTLFTLAIKGFHPSKLLAEEVIAIDRELYLSLTINREQSQIELLASRDGGVEIESQNSEAFFRRAIDPQSFDQLSTDLAEYFELDEKAFLLQDILSQLYRCFTDNDCLLLEINPLILTKQGSLVAGDAKVTVDDAARFRHPDWQFEDTSADHNFVVLDQNGTVATIANGAGLAMATVDAVTAAGLTPANFLDIGGTATPEKILECFRQITKLPRVNVIIINIFGGIVRCDDVAAAIVRARQQLPNLPRLAVRLTGNRETEAKQLLAKHDITLYQNLETILEDIS